MNKLFSTLETLRILLDNKVVMFDVIRQMDRSGNRYINEAKMAIKVLEHIKKLEKSDKQRVQIAFSTENLLQTHILADRDTYNGITRMVFQEAVIGLFRLCDASLYQELTDSKLKSRLAGLWRVQERFESGSLSYYDADPDYTELVDDTFEQLSMLLDILKRNVVRMKSLSQDFESMSTKACKDPVSFAQFRENLLVEVSTLFERHIKPTQSFLNHNVRFKEGDNLFETLNTIKLAFERNNKIDKADQVFRFSLSFSSIFKPITVVAHQVDQFLQKTRTSMAQFNAMEHHIQQLNEAYEQTLESNLNKTKINALYAKGFNYVNGLKKLNRPKDLRINDSHSYFSNLFSEIEIRLTDDLANILPSTNTQAWHSDIHSSKLNRALKLYEYLSKVPMRPTNDLTAVLHYRLKDVMEDYQLIDLFSAVTRLRQNQNNLKLRATNRKAYISHGDDIYVYRRKQLIEKALVEEKHCGH